tara:strand:- start:6187 stop:7710 length:1524 start_codon:yes stop_codon:yes gene_type:complete
MTTVDTNIPTLRNSAEIRRPFRLSSADRSFLVAVLCTLLAVRVLFMLWLPFTDTTEARYAEIARKMIETGNWITPQFDYGVPFWGKPPLHTWLSALGMQIFGIGGFGARIFIFLSGLAVLGLTGSFVKRHVGRDQALLVMAILFSSILFFGASAFVMTDMVMMLGTTLSMVAFYNCALDHSSRTVWGHLFFVGLAIGLLAKGPVATVLTLMPIGLWILIGRRWSLLSALPWLSGSALLLALTLPWYVVAELKTPGFLRYFIIGEHFERFTVSGWQGDLYGSGHARAKGLIWLYWLGAFMPWTLFAGWLLLRARDVASVVNADARGWHSYLLLWAVAPMLLFTPAANILAAYVLPGIPAAAILLVSLWASAQGAPGTGIRSLFGLSICMVTSLFLVITVLSHFSPDTLNLKSQQALVERAAQVDPDIQLTYWGGRSYSAEFYTRGRAKAISDHEGLRMLGLNDVRDAVAVGPDALDQVTEVLGDQFESLGKFGRNVLLVEAVAAGEKP